MQACFSQLIEWAQEVSNGHTLHMRFSDKMGQQAAAPGCKYNSSTLQVS